MYVCMYVCMYVDRGVARRGGGGPGVPVTPLFLSFFKANDLQQDR